MSETLEELQTIDEHLQQTITLLTQADQAIEQAHQLYHQYSRYMKDPPDLLAALKAVQDHLHGCIDQHNKTVAEIKVKQEEAARAEGTA